MSFLPLGRGVIKLAKKERTRRKVGASGERGGSAVAAESDNSDFLFGRKPLMDLLRASPRRIKKIYLQADSEFSPELRSELSRAEQRGILQLIVDSAQLDQLAQGVRHQGVAAQIEPRQTISLKELIVRSLSDSTGAGILVVLDEISDPHNTGAILRAVAASGADGVVLSTDRSAGLTPVVRKTSAGASEVVDIAKVTNVNRALEELKKSGFWLVGTTLDVAAENLYSCNLPHPLALVLGSEGKGLRELTKKHCDLLVKIPILGQIESLNVSQAAAVLLFELVRRKQQA